MPSLLDLEFCIIGSDGLFSVLAFQTAVNMVKDSVSRGRSGEEACRELVTRARQWAWVSGVRRRSTKDDISVIILFFHIKKHQKSPPAMEPVEVCAYDDSGVVVEEEEAKERVSLPRCLSDVSQSVHSSRQSARVIPKASIMEVFRRNSATSTGEPLPVSVSKATTQ